MIGQDSIEYMPPANNGAGLTCFSLTQHSAPSCYSAFPSVPCTVRGRHQANDFQASQRFHKIQNVAQTKKAKDKRKWVCKGQRPGNEHDLRMTTY